MTELNKLSDLDYRSLEEVAYHSKTNNPDTGVPVKASIAMKLVATGHAEYMECSYLQYLKNPDQYKGIILTTKGRRIADERDQRELNKIEEKHEGLLKSLEIKK